MRRLSLLIVTILAMNAVAAEPARPALVEVQMIWDRGAHNAFTDLIRFDGLWYCAFREGKGHVSPDGALRIITSADGKAWKSAALLRSETADLRDPKLSRTPDGKLMLNAAAALHKPMGHTHQSVVWFSANGRDWDGPSNVADPNYWLWRVTWHKQTAYGIGYECGKQKSIRLYRSSDGKRMEKLVEKLPVEHYPNESSLVFLPDDTCWCLLRRDEKPATGMLGVAKPPYREWQFRDLGVRIGGPKLIRLPDGRYYAVVRLYDGKVRTALCRLDVENARLEEQLTLPSGGDTSYAGVVWHDGLLWISYYASHEKKTKIYLAKVRLP